MASRKDNGQGSMYFDEKSGYWYAEIHWTDSANGKHRKKFSGKTKTVVKKKLEEFKKELLLTGPDLGKRSVTFKEFAETWLNTKLKISLKPTSFMRKKTTFNYQVYPHIGHIPIEDITSQDVQKMVNSLLDEGMSYSSIKKAYESFMLLENKAANGDQDVTFRMLVEASGEIIAKAACVIGIHAGCQQLKELYNTMYLWGEWIYLVDAVDDYHQDKEAGHFNPLFLPDKPNSVSAMLKEIETQAKSVIDTMVLRNYESLVHELFRTHIPYRSGQVIDKIKMPEIEEKCHESSIQCEN